MKLRVEKNEFADIVGWAARNTPQRPSIPVLAGVKLTFDGLSLSVESFDYDVSAQSSMAAVGEGPGAVLVSARLLAEIGKALPNKPVELEAVGAHLQLVCGSGRFTLPTMPVEDYPTLPGMPEPVGTVDAAVFSAAVGQAVVSAGRDESLPMMTGVMLEFDGQHISLLSTDRYRLTDRTFDWKADHDGGDLRALVPAKTLHEMAKALNTGTVTVALTTAGQGEGLIGFEAGGRRMTSRLLDGSGYPPVRTLFPKPEAVATEVTVGVAALAEVVKRVALVAERTTPVLLTFNEDGAVVEAGGSEEARASETLPAEAVTFDGKPITIGFNPQYLLDGLGALDTPEAHIAFVDAVKPAVISPAAEGGPAGGHRYLMMPIRVSR